MSHAPAPDGASEDVASRAAQLCTLLASKANGDAAAYNRLLQLLGAGGYKPAPTSELRPTLFALARCASQISAEAHGGLVSAVLALEWADEPAGLADPVLSFVADLVLASPVRPPPIPPAVESGGASEARALTRFPAAGLARRVPRPPRSRLHPHGRRRRTAAAARRARAGRTGGRRGLGGRRLGRGVA